MPLLRAEVRSEYALGAPELYREANREDPKEILEAVSVAGLVGVLRQLGDLADFAAEVFHGLQEEVAATSSRSHKLMARVHQIEAALSPLEKAILAQRSHLHFAYTAGSHWHARIGCEQNHFVYSDVPQFIMDSYEDCRGPPSLHLLDKFDPGGPGSCLKRYSDPTYFKRASLESGGLNSEKILKEKKGRKIKKRSSWPRNFEASRGVSFSHHSGRMEFIQRKVGEHTSPSQTTSTQNGTSRSGLGEQSNFDLRNGAGCTEGDFRPSYSTQPEEQESTASISSPMMRRDNDFLDYNFLGGEVPDTFNDVRGTLSHEQAGCGSSSAAWDKKTETHEPVKHDYDHDVMSEEDEHVVNLESPSSKPDLETLSNTVNFGTVDNIDIRYRNPDLSTLKLVDTNPDEAESETDHFMDALNTIESEPETEIDCTIKPEVEHSCESEDKVVDNGIYEVRRNSLEHEYSSYGIVDGSLMIGDSGEDPTPVPLESPSAAYSSSGGQAAENELKPIFPVNEALLTSQSIDSHENDNIEIGTTVAFNIRDDNESGVPITDRSRSISDTEKPAPQNSTVTSAAFWTNGGLLGLQPSKPPDFSPVTILLEDPKMKKNENFCSSTMTFASLDKNLEKAEIVEDFKNKEAHLNMDRSILEESETSPFRKPSWKISPADLDVKLGKSGQTGASSTVMVSGGFVPVNPAFSDRKHQENNTSSSRMLELSNRLLTSGSNKKLLPGGLEDSPLASHQIKTAFDPTNRQNAAHRIFSLRSKDLSGSESLILSPSSSPPLEHMKISFQPLDGFEISKLKLKFPYGNMDNENSRDAFPSFQLVPEVSVSRHNIDLDSDDDTFYRSSPSVSDGCCSHQSDSNSEQWESGESTGNKDHELYDAFRGISLTESVSSVPENGLTPHRDIQRNCGLEFPLVENCSQNSESCRSSGLQSLDTLNHSFREELRNSINVKDLTAPHDTAPPPPPPVQPWSTKPHLDDANCGANTQGSNYLFGVKISESAVSQQPKPAPFYQEGLFETTNVQKSKQFSTQKSNGGREDNQRKNMDENDFLHQIRTKSFNLRPTLKTKPTVPSGVPANVQVTAILEKANAIRQAVGSDDGEEDGTWSDS